MSSNSDSGKGAARQRRGKSPTPAPPARRGSGQDLDLKPMQRIWVDSTDGGVTPPPEQGLGGSILAIVTLLLFCGVMHILTALAIVAAITRNMVIIGILLAAILSVFLPYHRWDWMYMHSPIVRAWRNYFRFSFVTLEKLDPAGRYVFAESPHGVMPLGPVLAGTVVDDVFPGMTVQAVSASNVFNTPLYRHFMGWMGAVPATEKNFLRMLEKDCCAVVIGGLAEMYTQEADRERIILHRKGFVRVALKSGADLVPIYHFGNTKLMDILGKGLKDCSRKLRASFLLPYGRFGLPIPYRQDVMMAIGKPIKVPKAMAKDEEGFDAEVDRLHALFVKGMKETYDKAKGIYGWSDMPLSIE